MAHQCHGWLGPSKDESYMQGSRSGKCLRTSFPGKSGDHDFQPLPIYMMSIPLSWQISRYQFAVTEHHEYRAGKRCTQRLLQAGMS